jgi:hypothetical protein
MDVEMEQETVMNFVTPMTLPNQDGGMVVVMRIVSLSMFNDLIVEME